MVLQLHAAVVELSTAKGAEIKYSTVQNWFSGDENVVGGIYNFVTKRGICHGDNSKISWTQVLPSKPPERALSVVQNFAGGKAGFVLQKWNISERSSGLVKHKHILSAGNLETSKSF